MPTAATTNRRSIAVGSLPPSLFELRRTSRLAHPTDRECASLPHNGKGEQRWPSRSRNQAAASRTAAQKKSPARKTARKTAAKSTARKKLKSKGRAPAPAKRPRAKQRIAISHHREEDFKADGLRAYAHYRDLGFAGATHGLAQAHVIRLIGPCDPAEVSKLHFHDVDFQMVYVLKGWVKTYMEGQGESLMEQGSAGSSRPASSI